MKIIYCFSSNPHPIAVEAIEKYVPEAEFVKTEGLFGYNAAIASFWNASDDLIVIEGDKEISADTIPSFTACYQPWCTFAYETLPAPYTKTVTYGLGCAKFSVKIQELVDPSEFLGPDVPWQPCRHCDSKGCWNQLDVRMMRAFQAHGVDQPHVHGEVKHHHVYDVAWWREWKKDWDYLHDVEARVRDIQNWGNNDH